MNKYKVDVYKTQGGFRGVVTMYHNGRIETFPVEADTEQAFHKVVERVLQETEQKFPSQKGQSN